jgi:hypothetical protein
MPRFGNSTVLQTSDVCGEKIISSSSELPYHRPNPLISQQTVEGMD